MSKCKTNLYNNTITSKRTYNKSKNVKPNAALTKY